MVVMPWQHISQADRAQFWATLALKHSQGIGPRTIVRLLKYFGSAYAALENTLSWHEAGVSREKAQLYNAGSWRTTALDEWHKAQISPAHILLWHHDAYPQSLRTLIDAPPLLYYSGDISLLTLPCVAIVGSRKCSAEGVQVTGNIARELSRAGICVVSGGADGIDRVAHVAALAHVGKSIGVLGTGLDIAYPKSNEDLFVTLQEQGLLLTEYAPQTPPLASHFPIRNRIVSGLSLGVLVVEGMPSSGSLITARLALEQNREVYAIPGPATASLSRGCQNLIRQGAKPVFNAEDILQDLALSLQEFTPKDVTQAIPTQATDAGIKQMLIQQEDSTEHTEKKEQDAVEKISENIHISEQSVAGEGADFSSCFSEEQMQDIQKILLHLHAQGPVHVDVLCAIVGKPVFYVNGLLVEMELEKYVEKMAGGIFKAMKART